MMTAPVETLHFLNLSNGPRFAVVTHPSAPPTGTGVLLCSGGWYAGSWNLNRLYVRLARYLAAQGHRVVRFDWYGSGESPGHLIRYQLTEPFVEDVLCAASLLEGSQRIVGAGICFGASSLLAASHRIERLEGVVLVSAMVPGSGDRPRGRKLTAATVLRSALRPSLVKGWFDPYTRRLYVKWLRIRWRAIAKRFHRHMERTPDRSGMATQVERLARRGVLQCFLYGEGDPNLPAYSTQPLASASASANVRIEVIPFDVDGSSTIAAQEATSRVIIDMVETVTQARLVTRSEPG